MYIEFAVEAYIGKTLSCVSVCIYPRMSDACVCVCVCRSNTIMQAANKHPSESWQWKGTDIGHGEAQHSKHKTLDPGRSHVTELSLWQ